MKTLTLALSVVALSGCVTAMDRALKDYYYPSADDYEYDPSSIPTDDTFNDDKAQPVAPPNPRPASASSPPADDAVDLGDYFKADIPCGNGAGKARDWTWRLTGPFAPAEMEITSGVDKTVYEQGDITADGLRLYMEYRPIQNGDQMCTTGMDATGGMLWLGGQVYMHNGEECIDVPTKTDGSPCCSLIFWHPDGTGNYQTECSGTVDLDPEGLFWFETVIPGNECTSSWGGDCGEHMHYALVCDECPQSPEYAGLLDYTASPQYISPNKYYIREVSQEEPYAAADIHVSRKVETPAGPAWQYTMVFGTSDRDETRAGAPPAAPGGLALNTV